MLLPREFEVRRKAFLELQLHRVDRRSAIPKLARDACDLPPGQPAGDDEVELREIWVHIEGDPVHRHPPRQAHSHRADLARADPHACRRLVARGLDAEARKRVDDRLLQQPKVAVDSEPEGVEVKHEVHDQLPGTVPGDIAAAIRFHKFNAEGLEPLGRGEHIGACSLPTRHRHDRRVVLKEEDRSRDRA